MPTDLYQRQQQLNLNYVGDLTVVGLGGIGFWVAIDAAMSGVPSLYLFDPDVVDAFLVHEEAFKEIGQRLQDAYEKPSVEHRPA